eukprot:TRINITY_DN3137_c0_g1_i4.p1 TRINITY_DN3137_c0_g1~~TRINITY_DN3137_c0_g1_i4.p1  ORF type:complete len:106 (+),score=38.90 TRINITY_DN3137_c0_g1_i4:71-388(+)
MIRRPPRSTLSSSSAASDVYKRQVPVMVLLNNIQTLRNPDCVCHGEWEERKHKIELDVKLSLIDIEEQVSDLIVFGLEQPLEENQDFNPTAIEWLVRKIRKVAVD